MGVGRTAKDILNIDSIEKNIPPKLSSTGRTTAARVTDEYTDQSEPHSDQRRGGLPGSPVTITPDAEVSHDGLGGRGSGKKNTDTSWDSSRS